MGGGGGSTTQRSRSDANPQISRDIEPLRNALADISIDSIGGIRQGPPEALTMGAAKLLAAMFDPSVLNPNSAGSQKFDPTGPRSPVQPGDTDPFRRA